MALGRTAICLNMIVKDEVPVIRRCLDSVLPVISTWCILDTGSTDGTQDVIREHLKHLPGELHQAPWKGFAASRTEAIRLAGSRAEYLLFLDADDQLVLPEGYRLPELGGDGYHIPHWLGGTRFLRKDLVATRFDWHYTGVLHEFIECPAPVQFHELDGPLVLERREGARSRDPRKYAKDVALLEQGLRDEPGNARYQFYLAQSYRDAGQPEKAVAAYHRRVALGGWDEEVYVSLYQIATLLEALARPESAVVHAYLQAHQYRPRRVEALGALAAYLRSRKQYSLAMLFAQAAKALPRCGDILFVDDTFHAWRCLDEFAVAAYWVGQYRESLAACAQLLAEGQLPEAEVARVTANRAFALQALSGCAPEAR